MYIQTLLAIHVMLECWFRESMIWTLLSNEKNNAEIKPIQPLIKWFETLRYCYAIIALDHDN